MLACNTHTADREEEVTPWQCPSEHERWPPVKRLGACHFQGPQSPQARRPWPCDGRCPWKPGTHGLGSTCLLVSIQAHAARKTACCPVLLKVAMSMDTWPQLRRRQGVNNATYSTGFSSGSEKSKALAQGRPVGALRTSATTSPHFSPNILNVQWTSVCYR